MNQQLARCEAPSVPPFLLILPPEVILHILSYLDLPDLAILSTISPLLHRLTTDPALHRVRILVVAPARIEHSLYADGGSRRPSIADLVRWNVMRGLSIERRWRMGAYFYSPQSVKLYNASLRLQRTSIRSLLTAHLSARPSNDYLVRKHILPDVESSSLSVSRSLIPTMRKLKWSMERDKLAKSVRASGENNNRESLLSTGILPDVEETSPNISRSLFPVMRKLKWSMERDKLAKIVRANGEPQAWLDGKGKAVVREGERMRLALCPDVKKILRFYESLGRQ